MQKRISLCFVNNFNINSIHVCIPFTRLLLELAAASHSNPNELWSVTNTSRAYLSPGFRCENMFVSSFKSQSQRNNIRQRQTQGERLIISL